MKFFVVITTTILLALVSESKITIRTSLPTKILSANQGMYEGLRISVSDELYFENCEIIVTLILVSF